MASHEKIHVPVSEVVLRKFSRTFPGHSPAYCGSNEGKTSISGATLETFIDTAYDPEITVTHRAAATNAICSYLKSLANCNGIHPLLSEELYSKAFAIIFERFEGAKGKSIRQLLNSYLVMFPKHPESVVENVWTAILSQVVRTLQVQGNHGKVKAALMVLSVFLNDRVVSLRQLTKCSYQLQGLDSKSSNTLQEDQLLWNFARTLFDWARYPESAPSAGQAICALIRSVKEQLVPETTISTPYWAVSLMNSMNEFPEALIYLRLYVFPTLFMIDFKDYIGFLEYLGLRTQPVPGITTDTFYSALQVGKEIGLVLESAASQPREITVSENHLFIPHRAFARLLQDNNSTIRIAGLSLLITSHSVTLPLTKDTLNCLKTNLYLFFLETDANIRGEVLSLIQRLLDRIKAATSTLTRTTRLLHGKDRHRKDQKLPQDIVDSNEARKELLRHQRFMSWFIKFLTNQLHPAAAYQRHITTLKALILVTKSGLDDTINPAFFARHALGEIRWTFHTNIHSTGLGRVLYDLIMNPFDDVRQLATSLLEMQGTSKPDAMKIVEGDLTESKLLSFLRRAEERMFQSGRADYADGASRTYALLFKSYRLDVTSNGEYLDTKTTWWKSRRGVMEHLVAHLEETIRVAMTDLSTAVTQLPMHGIISSIRYVLETPDFYKQACSGSLEEQNSWFNLHTRTINALRDVWQCVNQVLCQDAPEGHVPEDVEEDINFTTKDILSYSWRALKEASLLTRVLVTKAPHAKDDPYTMLSKEHLTRLSRLCFTELAELRHRGAFSSVAQAYSACCSRVRAIGCSDVLEGLFRDTIQCIKNKGSTTTRRSAGIPSLVVGLLSAEPGGPLFIQAMRELLSEALAPLHQDTRYGDSLPQVHAMNCLKAIFTSTVLGPSSEPYIISGLDIAGDCLSSNIWAIRNCGLMLFRALIDRLLGSSDSQNWTENSTIKASRLSYNDYPRLLDIIVKLLQPNENQFKSAARSLESVFPALKIIQRIPPPPERQKQISMYVLSLCSSPHWHVRDMAARTYANLISDSALVETVEELIPRLSLGQNAVHGRLNCISYLLKIRILPAATTVSTSGLLQIWYALSDQVPSLLENNPCPFTRAAFYDVLVFLETAGLKQPILGSMLSTRLESLSFNDAIVNGLEKEESIVRQSLSIHLVLVYLLRISPDEDGRFQLATDVEKIFSYLIQTSDEESLATIYKILVDLAPDLPQNCINIITESLRECIVARNKPAITELGCRYLAKFYLVLRGRSTVIPTLELPLMSLLYNEMCKDFSPSLLEGLLQIWGPVLETHNRLESLKTVTTELNFMINMLRPLLHESRSFDTRYAAASCLAQTPCIWRQHEKGIIDDEGLKSVQLRARLLTYDILNDDDDEIRALGVTIAAASMPVVKKTTSELVPLVASRHMLAHVANHDRHSTGLTIIAIERMTGSSFSGEYISLIPSVRDILEASGNDDSTLFVVEKQNLYIDEIRETSLWSQVLESISMRAVLTGAEDRDNVNMLCSWVTDGLECILKKAEHNDGALGWSSRPEIFVLIWRILCGADVLMNWRLRSRKVKCEGTGMRAPLIKLLEVGRRKGLHELILEKVERIIVKALKKRLGLMGKRLGALEGYICQD
ncbi:hypothetical protein EJ08DRAFT_470303 [Tothia fuscella]|uniref:DUF2428 domain-containing protein n=1 Tax=Tothia fuscella TaxID=1048955 RepID=A0A9P4NZJ1_9PEZI|nr:hypothetical protein EJ08DRAFT_470303 [Tothia fuscella]